MLSPSVWNESVFDPSFMNFISAKKKRSELALDYHFLWPIRIKPTNRYPRRCGSWSFLEWRGNGLECDLRNQSKRRIFLSMTESFPPASHREVVNTEQDSVWNYKMGRGLNKEELSPEFVTRSTVPGLKRVRRRHSQHTSQSLYIKSSHRPKDTHLVLNLTPRLCCSNLWFV